MGDVVVVGKRLRRNATIHDGRVRHSSEQSIPQQWSNRCYQGRGISTVPAACSLLVVGVGVRQDVEMRHHPQSALTNSAIVDECCIGQTVYLVAQLSDELWLLSQRGSAQRGVEQLRSALRSG